MGKLKKFEWKSRSWKSKNKDQGVENLKIQWNMNENWMRWMKYEQESELTAIYLDGRKCKADENANLDISHVRLLSKICFLARQPW